MKPELVNNRVKRKEREKIIVTKDYGEKEQEILKEVNTTEVKLQQVRKYFFRDNYVDYCVVR